MQKTLSYNHKHICPKKPAEVVKDSKEDIEDIVVNKIKTFINQKDDRAKFKLHTLISQAIYFFYCYHI